MPSEPSKEPNRSPIKVFVLSRRGQGAAQVKRAFERDQEGEPAPYGFNFAEQAGWLISYSEDRPATWWSRAFFSRFEFDFFHALDNLRGIRQADVVWTMLEWEWLGVALLQRLRLAPRRPVIANSVWLADKWRWHPGWKRAFLAKLMLPHFDLTVHSKRGLEVLKTAIPVMSWRVSKFGVSTRAFPITPPKIERHSGQPIKVYSIGNDGTRDWSTMLAAFGNDPRFEVTIICRWLDKKITSKYGNVRAADGTTIARQRAEYQHADFVIVPMVENNYSGITVAMEAVAMGKPVICTRTGGVDTYFGDLEMAFVPAEDPAALQAAIFMKSDSEFLDQAKRAQSRLVQHGYTAEAMIQRYLSDTKRLLTSQAR